MSLAADFPTALLQAQIPWLLCGVLGGYLLVMFTNPARASFRDGIRAVRRYSTPWFVLGALGFFYALFQLGLRVYFYFVAPPGDRPSFRWVGEAWHDPALRFTGSPESLWFMPPGSLRSIALESILPTLDSAAGIFNNLVTTFPIAVVAAVLLLINWGGHHRVLVRALRKHYGASGWLVYLGIVLCALAVIVKPFTYFVALSMDGDVWVKWGPVVDWLASLFEYLFGVFIQIYLILMAYCWVRGLSFTHDHLVDFALRRLSSVVKWAAFVMLLSSIFIDVPLILKNFPAFSSLLPPEPEAVELRLMVARGILAAVLLAFSTVQITLVFHSESWRRALRDHFRFLARHWWVFTWFLIVSVIHLYALHVLNLSLTVCLGEGTALAIGWTLVFPWIAGLIGAWLLASWVCLFKRCDTGRAENEDWIKF
jgi:hypothetical protein